MHTYRVVRKHTPSRKGSEKGSSNSEKGFAEGSQKVLRRCLVVRFEGEKGSQKNSLKGFLEGGLPESV